MEKLEIGKKYRTYSNNKEFDFDYEVLDIKNNQITYKIIRERGFPTFVNHSGTKTEKYNLNSQFVKNSEVLK